MNVRAVNVGMFNKLCKAEPPAHTIHIFAGDISKVFIREFVV